MTFSGQAPPPAASIIAIMMMPLVMDGQTARRGARDANQLLGRLSLINFKS